MNFVQILGTCPAELVSVMAIIGFVVRAICIAIPIILIVLIILDLAKIVTAGNANDEKVKKEVTGKVVTRLIFAVLIFLVPTIIRLVFGLLPLPDGKSDVDMKGETATWKDCWDQGMAKGIVL